MPVLTATNVHHAFGDHVILDGVSLSIEPDERIGVVGRNGSGKSTLLRAMAGTLKPDGGEISLRRGCRIVFPRIDLRNPAPERGLSCAWGLAPGAIGSRRSSAIWGVATRRPFAKNEPEECVALRARLRVTLRA